MNDLKSFPSEKLCEIIVAFRYLHILKEEAVQSMNELSLRRLNGEVFNYEEFIDNALKELPKLSLGLKKINVPKF